MGKKTFSSEEKAERQRRREARAAVKAARARERAYRQSTHAVLDRVPEGVCECGCKRSIHSNRRGWCSGCPVCWWYVEKKGES